MNLTTNKLKTRKISIIQKILLLSICLSTIVCTFLGIAIYFSVSASLLRSIKNQAMETAQIAASNIDGDIHKAYTKGDETTASYQEMKSFLQTFSSRENIAFIYTMRILNDNEVNFVVSSDTEETTSIMDLTYPRYNELDEAFQGTASVDKQITTDEWGSYITGYAPIYDSDNSVVAIVGVDYSISSIKKNQAAMKSNILIFTACCWLISILASFLLLKRFKKNLNKVIAKVAEVSNTDGDLTRELSVTSGDELELIATYFNSFLSKVRGTIRKVNDTTADINNFTTKTSNYFVDNKQQASLIAATMQNLCASMEEIQSSMENINSSTEHLNNFLSGICADSIKQSDFANAMINRATQIKEQSSDSKAKTLELMREYCSTLEAKIAQSKSVYQISELTNDIIDISSQTNLLSLNASIEAARAGEHGRGFSIVASEIGSLADTSSKTATQISTLSTVIIDAVDGLSSLASQIIEYLSTTIVDDYEQMERTGEQYKDDASNFLLIMNHLNSNSIELQEKFSLVSKSLTEITDVLAENTSEIATVTGVSEQLYAQSEAMNEQIKITQKLIHELTETLGFFKV